MRGSSTDKGIFGVINHPIPRPASSRDADDDQFGTGTFLLGRFFVFIGTLAAMLSLPDAYAKQILGIVIVTLIAYTVSCVIRRIFRHG